MSGERTLPGLGLKAYWTPGSNGWDTENDKNIRMLSALVQARVLDIVSSLPGSPTDGDVYILTDGGANDQNVAIRDNGAWVYFAPAEGWMVYNLAAGAFWTFGGATWAELATGGSGSGSWLTGSGVPNDADGADGDFYLRSNGDVYQKATGTWGSVLFSILGPAGADGANGTSFPAFSFATKTASYVAVTGDFSGNKLIEMNVASANTFTVNSGLTGTEPLAIAQMGAGQTTIVAGSGVTILSSQGLKLRAVDSVVTLIPCGSDRYRLAGDTTL